ncbi:NRF6-like protein [Mya arenaria]|uniref:NRF6-like protein n=1 Tax=Mya arenaria TaxID=6604 RepID=A0ABY7EY18_MYAAR|nr:NRF6-like protein [Mya arenaria]
MNIRAEIPFNATLGQHIVTKDRSFQGKYCRATFDPPRSLIESVLGDNINHTYGLPLTISLGMCMPDSCAGSDIEGLLNLGILGSLFNLTVAETVCTEDLDFKTDDNAHARNPGRPYSAGDSVVDHRTILSAEEERSTAEDDPNAENGSYDNAVETLTDNIKLKENGVGNKKGSKHGRLDLNVSVDSDLTENILDKSDDDDEGLVRKLLRSFSIFTNLPAVMSTEVKNFDISCLYGIRVITMTWIVLGNTYLYTAQSVAEVPVAADLMDSFDLMKRFTMQAVLSTAFATDTFFLISGCLIAYWFLAKDEMRVSKINVKTLLKFYAGKYWKLTPPYMLVMVMFVYLYTYLGDGPMWPNSIPVADACRKSWWKHLLYVNNLFGVDGVAPEDQCMAWSWYMAATMQFYLVSPILLSLMAFSTTMGCAVTGILAVAGVIAAGVKEAEIGGQILTSREDGGQYWNSVFTKPWCRISSYCVGLLLGLVLQRFYHKIINKYIAGLCWLLFTCVGVLLVYVPYTQHVDALADWSLPEQGAYEALARPVWAMCVGWVIYACATGYGGPVSDFLSWKGFVPLSRVTFLVYLIHPVLMVLAVYTRRTMLNLNDFQMAYQFVGHVVINYVAAIFAALVFDFPFRNLKRVVQRKTLNSPF